MKCGECPNQAFLPVEDKIILDHLQGRHVMGVYPLLTNETCWFLAADFDKASWTDDVAAFTETCRAHGLPAAVERSRSGNGAHVWFFFSAPVAASTARQMGCYLITETMQWQFLSECQRIAPTTADSLAREATREGRVVGVRLSDTTDTESSEPWTRRPSGQPLIRFSAPLPPEVRAVLAQRLFVTKGGLARIHLTQRDEIVAVCRRAGVRQTVPILDLPLPSRRPAGAEWIDAYRHWAGGR